MTNDKGQMTNEIELNLQCAKSNDVPHSTIVNRAAATSTRSAWGPALPDASRAQLAVRFWETTIPILGEKVLHESIACG